MLKDVAKLQNIAETCVNGGTKLTQPRSASVHGVVYFVKCWNAIKIGFTDDLPRRLAQLQTCSPFELEVLGFFPGTMKDEIDTQGRFAPLHIRGEWFYPHPELFAHIKKVTKHKRKRKLAPPPSNLEKLA